MTQFATTPRSPRKQKGMALLENMVAALVLGGGLLGVAKLQGYIYTSTSYSKNLTEAQVVSQRKLEDLRAALYSNVTTGTDNIAQGNATYTRTWTVTNNTNYKDVNLVTSWLDQAGKTQTAKFFTRISQWAQLGSLDMLYVPQANVTPYPATPTPGASSTPSNSTPAPSGSQTTAPTSAPALASDQFTFGNYSVRAVGLNDGSGRSIKCSLIGVDNTGATIESNTQQLLEGVCSQDTSVDGSNNFVVSYTCSLTRRSSTIVQLLGSCSLFDSTGTITSSACGVVDVSNAAVNQSISFDFTLNSNGGNSGAGSCSSATPTPSASTNPTATPNITATPATTTTPTPTSTATATPAGTATPTPASTATPTATPVVTTSPTPTPVVSTTPTPAPFIASVQLNITAGGNYSCSLSVSSGSGTCVQTSFSKSGGSYSATTTCNITSASATLQMACTKGSSTTTKTSTVTGAGWSVFNY